MTARRLLIDAFAPPAPNANTYTGSTKTAAAAYHERDGAALEYFAGKYWLLGGWWDDATQPWAPDVLTNEVWSSPDLVTWTQELTHDASPQTSGAGARWKGRHTFGHWQSGGYIYVAWGDQSPELDVWRSSDPGNVDGWTQWAPTLTSPVNGPPYNLAGWVVFKGALYVFGGYRSTPTEATREVWRSDDNGQTWERLPDMPFQRASFLSPAVLGERVFIIGGSSENDEPRTFHNDVWAFDGWTWRQTGTTASWTAADWVSSAAYDGKLWRLTGATPGDDGACAYTEDYGQSWTTFAAPWAGSHADAVCVTAADGIVVASGHGHGTNVYAVKRD